MRCIGRLQALMLLLACGLPLSASFTTTAQPDSAYTASTTLLPVTVPELDPTVGALTDGILIASFSEDLQEFDVPTDWLQWGTPPAVENSTPRVLATPGINQTLLTILFSEPLTEFGLEAMPDAFGPTDITENFYNGSTNIGSITLGVDGSSSAALFAASSTIPITSVDITAVGTDLAIGDLRYATETPEPNTWITLAAGLLSLGALRRKKLGK